MTTEDKIIQELKIDYEDCDITDEQLKKVLVTLKCRGYLKDN